MSLQDVTGIEIIEAGNLDGAEKKDLETAAPSLPNQTIPNQTSKPVQHVSPDTQENEEAGNLDEAEKIVPETAVSSLPNEASPTQTSEPVQHVISRHAGE